MLWNNRFASDASSVVAGVFELGIGVAKEIKSHLRLCAQGAAQNLGFVHEDELIALRAALTRMRERQAVLEKEVDSLKSTADVHKDKE